MNQKVIRSIARALLGALVLEIVQPLAALALTSGPTQPEFSSFEPVTTTSMVNEFTGAFTYNLPVLNVPGPNGSGYAVSLSYHSGESPEGEASWVGYGWTLNPGAITRNKRGFPDDCKGATVRYWNKTKPNWTVTVGAHATTEIFSFDGVGLGLQASLRYNNYKGFGYTAGLSVDAKGIGSLGYNVDNGGGSFSYSINTAGILSGLAKAAKLDEQSSTVAASMSGLRQLDLLGRQYGMYTWAEPMRPVNVSAYSGSSVNFSLSPLFCAAFLPIGAEVGLNGSYTKQETSELPDDLHAYGYLYSAEADEESMMDYYVEKDAPYNKRDLYLGIPFSNADNFAVTGQGVGGAFRAYNRRPGHFYPNEKTSITTIGQMGGEVHAGVLNFGVGFDIGIGVHTLSVSGWKPAARSGFAKYGTTDDGDYDEPYFFRLNNDLGGNVLYADNDNATQAWNDLGGPYGFRSADPNLSNRGVFELMNNGRRSGRASYIGYHTNAEMLQSSYHYIPGFPQLRRYYNSYERGGTTRSHVDRTKTSMKDQIGEFSVVGEDGQSYVYGLPVYSRNERNYQFGLAGLSRGRIDRNHIARRSTTPADAEVVAGEERDAPYASSYLLTEITTSDFVDRTSNGPSPDDYGGYTKFNYVRTAGSTDKTDNGATASASWYRWRIPYSGLLYNRNSLSDPDDDVGSVVLGDKELYFLESIETKTHIAKFITGDRDDAWEANHDEPAASDGVDGRGSESSNVKQRKLIRIELYAKNAQGNPGKLLQTVNFDYDYSLCRDLPNAKSGSGHLTLRKIWFEYDGALNARISPYVFGYEYKRSQYFATEVQGTYGSIVGFADHFFAGGAPELLRFPGMGAGEASQSAQNPNYSPFILDRWGNYQYDGRVRHDAMNPWVNQAPDLDQFDPAAWQLKWIKLPSGGEIHVQYEQNDYRYVQDRPAMAMVSLKSVSGNPSPANRFYLDVSDLGLRDDQPAGSPQAVELNTLAALIKKRFKDDGEKIYYKMLFPLKGSLLGVTLPANLQNCTSEYITGFASVQDVGVDSHGLYISVGSTSESYDTPSDVCEDLYKTSKRGNLRIGQVCDASEGGLEDDGNIIGVITTLLGKTVAQALTGDVCNAENINHDLSYLRVPMTRAKLGGGVRVKRLLMYDPGLESGAATLYGSEYLYQTPDGQSSGVAVNEPATGREESSLVTSLVKRTPAGSMERIIAGDEREEFEGPLGESLLPAPSVGYSRVVVRPIHSGSTRNGFVVNEFITAKDYPFDATSPIYGRSVDETQIDAVRDWIPTVPLGPVSFGKANVWMTQGYRFVLNNMHGQPRRISTYGGTYADTTTWSMSAQQQYDYFEPGESVMMNDGVSEVDTPGSPGKEMDVTMMGRSVEDIAVDGNVEIDVSFSIVPWIPFVFGPITTAAPSIAYSEKKLRTHVTSKVVRYPAILKGLTVYRDGVYHRTDNVAFNPATGRPFLTRTSDGYDGLKLQLSPPFGAPATAKHVGLYHTYSFPASKEYEAMGQKASNERTIILSGKGGVTVKKFYDQGVHYLSISYSDPAAACRMASRFSSGDLIRLTHFDASTRPVFTAPGDRGIYQVLDVIGNRLKLEPVSFSSPSTNVMEEVDFEVVRSGKTNQLSAAAGSITTYGPRRWATKQIP